MTQIQSGAGAAEPAATASTNLRESSKLAEREIEKWIVALGQGAKHPLPQAFLPLGEQSSNAWRPSDNALTPDPRHAPAAQPTARYVVSGSGAEEPPDERVTLTVDGGDLGDVSLLVRRDKEGLRVVLRVSGAHAESAMKNELAVLQRSLAASGVAVASVAVVQAAGARAKDGPKLAQDLGVQAGAFADRGPDDKRTRERDRKRVHLIG